MYRYFWQLFVKGYGGGRMAVLICVTTIVASLLEGINMGLLVPLLESLDSEGPMGGHWLSQMFATGFAALHLPMNLNTILPALAIVTLIVSGIKYFNVILALKINLGFSVWIRSRIMGNLLRTDLSYFHREELGQLTNTVITQVPRGAGVFSQIVDMITNLALACAYLTTALLISPLLTGIALGAVLVLTMVVQFFIVRARAMGTREVQVLDELHSAVVENLSGIRVIKSFLLEELRWMDSHRAAVAVGQVAYEINRAKGQTVVIQEIALFSLIGAIVYTSITVIGLDLAATVAILFILYRMAPKINGLNNIRQSLAVSMASLHRIKTTIEETSEPKVVSGTTPFVKLHKGIELKKVTFSYDGGPDVLHEANFTMKKGEMTALVGTSGAGKSTLIDLVLRFYDPVEGSLLVDGVDLKELDLQSWRKTIGVVSQDVFLFNDTIANNIVVGDSGAPMERVVEAAKRAYAHDFIQKLPQGYDTVVGDRGWNLSGGQRQRIALARAILKKSEILVLDEATSSLDSESESLIQNYIREIRGTCTIIIVAHRMSTIQDADKIAVLEDGRIVEEGDWDSLLAEQGTFANYHRLQFRT